MEKASLGKRFGSVDLVVPLLLAIALLLFAWVSAWPIMSPAVVPASAPKTSFSAERAMGDLRVVAREPHGAGSEAQFRVRDYILAEAAAAGLKGEVQKGGIVENVIVRLPGSATTGDVLLSGHYDSHPPAPGAGDNGISVAAMLETMRVLRAGPAPRNDIVFLFTDGEELGWLGASAYIKEHPATKQTQLALVFDGRPGNGPLTLRETSRGDAWLVQQIAAARPPLWAASWLNAEERTDNDTDFTGVFAPAGFMGVEIENMARGTRYHTAGDTVDAISPGLVQAQGETMLRLARHFGGLDLGQARPSQDVTYFTVPSFAMVVYPPWVTPAAAALATVALVTLVVVEWRRARFSIVRSLLGALAFLVALIVITLISSRVWSQLLATRPVTWEVGLNYADFAGSSLWIAGIMTVALILGILVLYGLSRRLDAVSLTISGLLVYALVWIAAYLFLDSDNPVTHPPIVWPFVSGVAGLAILAFVRHRAWMAALLFLAAIPIFVLAVPAIVPEAFRPQENVWVPVLTMSLLLGVVVPQIAFITGRLSSATGV
jgi:hypothetical protein